MARPTTVVSGQPIASAWGNDVVDTVSVSRGLGLSQSGISVATGQTVNYTWDFESGDSHGFYTPGSQYITIPGGQEGVYAANFKCMVTSPTDQVIDVSLYVAGSLQMAWILPGKVTTTLSVVRYMPAGSSFNCQAWNGATVGLWFAGSFDMNRVW
jgi:hypothetical protein